jgi:hypothetical protein
LVFLATDVINAEMSVVKNTVDCKQISFIRDGFLIISAKSYLAIAMRQNHISNSYPIK